MSEVISGTIFSIHNQSADASMYFWVDNAKTEIKNSSTWQSGSIPAAAEVPFNVSIGSTSALSLYIEESEDLTSIQVTELNGWVETQNNNPYVFTYGTGDNGCTLSITLSDSNPAPDEIGILIVGTTECDPEENK